MIEWITINDLEKDAMVDTKCLDWMAEDAREFWNVRCGALLGWEGDAVDSVTFATLMGPPGCLESDMRKYSITARLTTFHKETCIETRAARHIENPLTENDMKMLPYLIAGLKHSSIAEELGITENAVAKAKERIFTRLNVDNSAELYDWALFAGLHKPLDRFDW